jgi:hypothetical protein
MTERKNPMFALEPFERSVRVSIRVNHVDGKLPATNVMGLLTIEAQNGKLSDVVVEKKDGRCMLERHCELCEGKTYLASPLSGVKSEALPWSLPIDAGTSPDDLRYVHLTHVPVGGSSLLRLFDVYRVKRYGLYVSGKKREIEEEFWLMKVHSEYGTERYPRICLRIPVKDTSSSLHFIIKLAGENLRRTPQCEIKVYGRDGDCIIEYMGKEVSLRDYFEEKGVKHLELVPKGAIY